MWRSCYYYFFEVEKTAARHAYQLDKRSAVITFIAKAAYPHSVACCTHLLLWSISFDIYSPLQMLICGSVCLSHFQGFLRPKTSIFLSSFGSQQLWFKVVVLISSELNCNSNGLTQKPAKKTSDNLV